MVHGEIDPSTVLLKTNRTVAICMPDFSTPLVSRVRKRYMLPNGYSFLAPECQQQQQPTVDPSPATDVFHLGLMTLLWHQPDDKVSSLSQLSEANFSTPVKLFFATLSPRRSKNASFSQSVAGIGIPQHQPGVCNFSFTRIRKQLYKSKQPTTELHLLDFRIFCK